MTILNGILASSLLFAAQKPSIVGHLNNPGDFLRTSALLLHDVPS